MTTQLSLGFWLEIVSIVALAVVVVFGLAGALVSRLRSGRSQRAVWLAAFTAVGLFLIGFGFGAERWLAPREAGTLARERTFVIRNNLPVGDTTTHFPAALEPEWESATATRVREPSAARTGAGWLVWIWMGGMFLVLGRAAIQRVALMVTVARNSAEAGKPLCSRIGELSRRVGLRHRVCVLEFPGIVSPAAFGWRRPTILVPHGFESVQTQPARDAMLLHELAHLVARDPFWFGVARLVVAALWWHPLSWWALVGSRE
jgi:hypothetical protein